MNIYLISDNGGSVKIGYATSVADRLAGLQTGNPRELRLLISVRVGSVSRAIQIEQILHQKCSAYHIRGEWFSERAVDIAMEYLRSPSLWPRGIERHDNGLPLTVEDRERLCLAIMSSGLAKKYPNDAAIAERIGAAVALVKVVRERWLADGARPWAEICAQ